MPPPRIMLNYGCRISMNCATMSCLCGCGLTNPPPLSGSSKGGTCDNEPTTPVPDGLADTRRQPIPKFNVGRGHRGSLADGWLSPGHRWGVPPHLFFTQEHRCLPPSSRMAPRLAAAAGSARRWARVASARQLWSLSILAPIDPV